jgi:Flp pilus assembly protein TadG
MRTLRAAVRSRRGGNAIEFALTLPLFLTILLGLMDYGYLFAMQAGIDNVTAMSCRDGAMVDPSKSSPIAAANAEFAARSPMFCGGGACSWLASDLSTGDYAVPNRTLKCQVSRSMVPLIGFLPPSMYPPTISSVSYYRLEWQRKPGT